MLPLLVSSHVIGPFYESLQVNDLASTALLVAIILPGFLLSKYCSFLTLLRFDDRQLMG